MVLAHRVIACLDVKNGRVVKGVNFKGLKDAGDPVELARLYNDQGIDELTFLDISASSEGRGTMLEVVHRTAGEVFIPLTVGGGVSSPESVDALLRAGADKVSINTAAIRDTTLVSRLSRIFGSQCIVVSVDAKRTQDPRFPSGFEVTTHGGKKNAGIDALEWVKTVSDDGAGEILLNSMDADGTGDGFDVEMISAVRAVTHVPVIASGGAGKAEHFPVAIQAGADAVLAASVFHFQTVQIAEVKQSLAAADIAVRV